MDAKGLLRVFDAEFGKLPGDLRREFADGRSIRLALPHKPFLIAPGPPACIAELTMEVAEFEARELRRGGHAVFGRMVGEPDWLYLSASRL